MELTDGTLRVVIPGTTPPPTYAFEFDVETLEMTSCTMEREGDTLTLDVHHRLSAVFMPGPYCKPLVTCHIDTDRSRPGGKMLLSIDCIRTWSDNQVNPLVNMCLPGITKQAIELPARIEIDIPATIEEGWYSCVISGEVLPCKRWFWIGE